MSLIGSLVSGAKTILRSPIGRTIVGAVGGPVGLAVATGYGIYQGMKTPSPAAAAPVMPGLGQVGQMQAGMFPTSLPAVARVGGAAVRVGVAGARRVYNAAAGYCRRHPQWCSTIGGIAAVEAMIGRGELPIPKRRRGKGISATELKNFKRVAKFTSQYCAPVRRAMSAPAVRRGKRCQ